MKNILLIAILLLPFYLLGQNTVLPVKLKKEAQLYKKLKVKTIKVLRTIEGEETKLFETRQFNKNGLVTEVKVLNSFEDGFDLKKSEYNDNGFLIRQIKESESGTLQSAISYEYKNGQLISEKHSYEEYSYNIYYVFNDKGQIDSSIIASAEMRRNAWFYNKNGEVEKILGFTIYNYDDPTDWVQVETQTFEYNKKGLLLKDSFCSDNQGCYIYTYEYNKKKQKSLTILAGESAEISRTRYEYNKKGLLVKESFEASEDVIDYMKNYVQSYEYVFY